MTIRLLLLFFIANLANAQSNQRIADSLVLVLSATKNDTVKARTYIQLHNALKESDNKKSLFYAHQGLLLVKKMGWNKGMAAFYNDLGNNYLDQSRNSRALEYFLLSLKYSEKETVIREMTYENIGLLYFKESNLVMSKKYYGLALALAEKNNLQNSIANCWYSYGLIHVEEKKLSEAKSNFFRSYELFKTENNKMKQAEVLMSLGDITNNASGKLNYFNQSKAIWDQIDPTYLMAISNLLGIIECNLELLRKEEQGNATLLRQTEEYLNDAIAYSKKANIQQNLMFAYGKMSELKELQGDYKTSLNYLNLNLDLYEKVYSQESKNKIASLESRQKLMEKDQQIAIKQLTIKQNEKQRWYLLFGMILFLFIGMLLFYQNRNRKKINELLENLNTELDQANKAKTRFFSILNHDLRSPVSNLIDFLHLQKDSPDLLDTETKSRIQNTTLTSAENLLTSMEDMLQWSKSQMEHYRPQPKQLFVSTLFEEINTHFSSEENVIISFENQENIELVTDENYLKTILRNLTGNAINALKNTENPTIIWKAFNQDSKTFLSITDNGPGANNKQFKALYDDKEVSGITSGLGLHLIRDLAKAIDCEILVETKLNSGTTITLKLK